MGEPDIDRDNIPIIINDKFCNYSVTAHLRFGAWIIV